jgi:hypothetical protein
LPGLTSALIRKHIRHMPVPTIMGHMQQSCQNQCSIQPPAPVHANPGKGKRTHLVFLLTVPVPSGAIAMDQTGAYPVTSASGDRYVMVAYDHDSSFILAEPIPNSSGYQFTEYGIEPR